MPLPELIFLPQPLMLIRETISIKITCVTWPDSLSSLPPLNHDSSDSLSLMLTASPPLALSSTNNRYNLSHFLIFLSLSIANLELLRKIIQISITMIENSKKFNGMLVDEQIALLPSLFFPKHHLCRQTSSLFLWCSCHGTYWKCWPCCDMPKMWMYRLVDNQFVPLESIAPIKYPRMVPII